MSNQDDFWGSLLKDKQIPCQYCLKDSGYTENGLRHFVIRYYGLKCKNCGQVIIEPRNNRCEASVCNFYSDASPSRSRG